MPFGRTGIIWSGETVRAARFCWTLPADQELVAGRKPSRGHCENVTLPLLAPSLDAPRFSRSPVYGMLLCTI